MFDGLVISRMNKVEGMGNLRAFFDLDVTTPIGAMLGVKGFKLVMSKSDELFVSMPSQKKTKDGVDEWNDTIFADSSTRNMIRELALAEYESPTEKNDKQTESIGDDDTPF